VIPARKSFRLSLSCLQDVVDPAVLEETDIAPLILGAPMRNFFEAALRRLETHTDLTEVESAAPHIPEGSLEEIQVIFCPPEAMDILFDLTPQTLGLFLVDTPDGDPFGDEAPEARALRVLIRWDAQIARREIEEAVQEFDGSFDPAELPVGAMGWLATLTHEIHHALWFAGNGNFNAAADLDVMTDDIGQDLFDIVTGYGIRPPVIDGEEVEPEDAEDAHLLMEEMIEARGRHLAEAIFTDALAPERFLELLAAEEVLTAAVEMRP